MAEETTSTPLDLDIIKKYFNTTATTKEEFIEQVGSKIITEDQIFKDEDIKKRVFGRAFGSATTGIKQTFEAEGIDITGDDLKQPIEAVTKLGIQKMKDKWAAERIELEKTAGMTADDKIKEFQSNIEKLTNKNKDYEKLLRQKADEFENLSANQKMELKKFKLSSTSKDITSSIKWSPDKDEFSRKGFLATMNEKYVIDLDENDAPFIVDRATNSRIKAEGSHSTFMTPSDVYQMEAAKSGLSAINKNAGQPANKKEIVTSEKKVVSSSLPVAGRKQMANTSFKVG